MILGIVVGHEPKRPGAFNKDLNITEYKLNEDLAFAIVKECLSRGIEYKLIYRKNGYSKLPQDINSTNVTHCICVHHNATDNLSVNGTETLYWKDSEVSDKFAKCVNDEMVKTLNYKNRRLKPISQGDRGGLVLRNTSMPCILIEPYFMSNAEAVKNRNNEKLASAIVDGYENFIKN